MGKKRSVGVTILGTSVIGLTLVVVVWWLLNMDVLRDFASIRPAMFMISISYLLILAICGIGILFFKNWARLTLLIFSILSLLNNIYVIIFYKSIRPIEYSEITSTGARTLTVIVNKPVGIYWILWIIQLILSIIILYYLTRPKVKEQFLKEESPNA